MKIIAGRFGGQRLTPPRDGQTRPALEKLRGALFDMLEPDLPGARVLDLFAGTGSLGLEALSRGARHVTFVERARNAAGVLRANLDLLDVSEQSEVRHQDAYRLADDAFGDDGFDLVLVDPPFPQATEPPLVELTIRIATAWLAPDGLLVLRLPTTIDAPDPQPGLVRLRDRQYGDSRLLIDHLVETSPST